MKLSGEAPPAFSSRKASRPKTTIDLNLRENSNKLAAEIDFNTKHLKRKKSHQKNSPAFNYTHTNTIYSTVELDSKFLY